MINRILKWAGVVAMTCIFVTIMVSVGLSGPAGTTDKAKVTSPGGYAALYGKAKTVRTVKVLVRLEVPFTAEPALPAAEAAAQRSSISRAQERLTGELAGLGHKPSAVHEYRYIPYLAMTVNEAALDALIASPLVAGIEEDAADLPFTDWSVARIGAAALQTSGVGGYGMTIAILDTGVDKNHPFLKDSVVSEACYSTKDPGRTRSLCPGGVTESVKSGSAMPYGGSCPSGKCDHGTHVAGIAAGRDNVAGSPGPGAAPEAKIIAIQVFSRYDDDADCGGRAPCVKSFVSDQLKALERVYALKDTYAIASVNMSLGGGEYTENCDTNSRKPAIDNLRAAGIATIIASGNDGFCGAMGAPACISTSISVGSTDESESVASSSNSASFLTLFAPGVEINSSIPGKKYAYKNGTSMATPHVAGAWALLKQGHPASTVDDILASLTSTGLTVTDSGKCPDVTKQRINAGEAYELLGPTVTLELTVNGNKKGAVTSGGSTCAYGSVCKWLYAPGTAVTLTANPATGAYLDEWSDCDTISDTGLVCNVTMSASRGVTATFNPPPKISVSPGSVNFGTVKIGNSPYKTIQIKNTGASTLTFSGITPRDLEPSFSIDASECAVHLAKSQGCNVYATFTPTTEGTFTGFIDIASDDPNHGTVTVKLTAKGKN